MPSAFSFKAFCPGRGLGIGRLLTVKTCDFSVGWSFGEAQLHRGSSGHHCLVWLEIEQREAAGWGAPWTNGESATGKERPAEPDYEHSNEGLHLSPGKFSLENPRNIRM